MSYVFNLPCLLIHCFLLLLQVVVKTRTEFQTEKKRLKVPKVEEFTISFTDGVSERLKVRVKQRGSKADNK